MIVFLNVQSRWLYSAFNNERYYHFTVGDALFVVLDSEGLHTTVPAFISVENRDDYWDESGIEYLKEQKEWLEEDLELNREAGFAFLFQHATLYSVKRRNVK